MTCIGVVRNMTAESAERAALGAGAIVMDVVSADEEREERDREEDEDARGLRLVRFFLVAPAQVFFLCQARPLVVRKLRPQLHSYLAMSQPQVSGAWCHARGGVLHEVVVVLQGCAPDSLCDVVRAPLGRLGQEDAP